MKINYVVSALEYQTGKRLVYACEGIEFDENKYTLSMTKCIQIKTQLVDIPTIQKLLIAFENSFEIELFKDFICCDPIVIKL